MTPERNSAPLVKTKRRVADHGEVFTPAWMVDDMLNLVAAEMERIDSRVLEPACGSGNFLVPVLRRKLASVEARYRASDFEKRHYALLSLMCVYGIELLSDNTMECRARLVDVLTRYLKVDPSSQWVRAAEYVVEVNVIQGDALNMMTVDGVPIEFPEWGYLGKGKFQRRDFRYDNLTERASFQGTLWDHLDEHEIFAPTRDYATMTVEELAA